MPSPEPTIRELVDVAGKAVSGGFDKNADFIRGSDYESLIGPAAVIWSRQAARDTDIFNAVNFNTADGDDLTDMAIRRFGKYRVLDTRGSGTAVLQRAAGGTAETIWAGSRLSVIGVQSKVYRVTQDTAVVSTQLNIPVPIEFLTVGAGSTAHINNSGNNNAIRIDDVLKDQTWFVASLNCGEGTTFEKAADFRSRIRTERRDSRVGQGKALIAACKAAGAANVALFRSDYAGPTYDHSLNVCYVGDLGYSGSPALVKACTLALLKVRVAGDQLQVLPMAKTVQDVVADVYLYNSPALFDLARLERIHSSAVSQYLNGTSGRFVFSTDGIRGALARYTPEVQRVVLTTPSADVSIVSGPDKNFPAVLNRYVPGMIAIRYLSA